MLRNFYMSQSRQLAAIMFTDIVGYTVLMGDNEKKAFELLNKNRQIQKPVIEEFNGSWIKESDAGLMASFNTVSDAGKEKMPDNREALETSFTETYVSGTLALTDKGGNINMTFTCFLFTWIKGK